MYVTWDVTTHLTTRIARHFHEESSVFRHLDNNPLCKEQCTKYNCFKILDFTSLLSKRVYTLDGLTQFWTSRRNMKLSSFWCNRAHYFFVFIDLPVSFVFVDSPCCCFLSSIIIWTSQCVLDIITFPAGGRHPSINTYYFTAVGCPPSILLKWHLAITEKDQSTYSNRRGSSEARWWNPECINTYKVSTKVITDYILNYIKEIVWA